MNIRVDLTAPIIDGTEVVFRSPVDCSQITGLIVYYNGDSKEFALADAHGNNVGNIDHLFAENVVVKVILDVTHSMAYVQNADTNAYLEGRFKELKSKINQGGGGASLTVTVTEDTDGAYTADLYSGQLYEAHNNGIILFCKYNGKNLPLIVASKAQVVFEGIYTGTLYKVTVGVNRVDVTSTPLATEAIRYTPQALTPEQQAQARQNIGACDEEYVNQAIENIDLPTGGSEYEKIIDFTTTERVTSFDIPLDKPMMEKLKAADSVVLSLKIPRDTEDTETTTGGTVSCGVYLTWWLAIGKDKLAVIPAPASTWLKNGFVKIEQHALQTAISDLCVTHTTSNLDGGTNSKTITHTCGIAWTRYLDTSSTRHYLRIEGTQNMAVGTRFVVEVKA